MAASIARSKHACFALLMGLGACGSSHGASETDADTLVDAAIAQRDAAQDVPVRDSGRPSSEQPGAGFDGGAGTEPGADASVQLDASAALDAGADTNAPSALRTVFVILMENKDWSQIVGNKNAPFLNSLVQKGAAYCTNYHNVIGQALHPSEPNYINLEAGDNLGLTTDANPGPKNCAKGKDHLAAQLEKQHIAWRSYQEGISGTGCPLTTDGKYAPRHNPVLFFDDVSGKDCSDTMSSYCEAHVRPYTELVTDLGQNKAGRYNFLTPNLCNDMHDGCGGDSIRQGDDWLSVEIPKIQSSDAYKQGGVIFITWDEGTSPGNNPIGMLAISPLAKEGAIDCSGLSHASFLKTLQNIFGVRPYLGAAADPGSDDLSRMFTRFP